jgi:uncharacterized membrane protein YqiK
MAMVGGPVVVAVAFGIFIVIWLVVLIGSRFFGPQ